MLHLKSRAQFRIPLNDSEFISVLEIYQVVNPGSLKYIAKVYLSICFDC